MALLARIPPDSRSVDAARGKGWGAPYRHIAVGDLCDGVQEGARDFLFSRAAYVSAAFDVLGWSSATVKSPCRKPTFHRGQGRRDRSSHSDRDLGGCAVAHTQRSGWRPTALSHVRTTHFGLTAPAVPRRDVAGFTQRLAQCGGFFIASGLGETTFELNSRSGAESLVEIPDLKGSCGSSAKTRPSRPGTGVALPRVLFARLVRP